MSNQIYVYPDIPTVLAAIGTVDTVVDAIRATDVPNIQTNIIAEIVPDLASCTLAGSIVEDGASGTANVISVTSGIANTWSPWGEMDAATAEIQHINAITVGITNFTENFAVTIEIGIGAGGSEVTIIRFSFYLYWTTAEGYSLPLVYNLPVPKRVAAGVRIALRAADDKAAGKQYTVGIQRYKDIEL